MPKRFHIKLRRSSHRIRPVQIPGELFHYHSSGGRLPTGRPFLRGRTLWGRRYRKQGSSGLWWRAGSWQRLSLGLGSLLYGARHQEDPLYSVLQRIQKGADSKMGITLDHIMDCGSVAAAQSHFFASAQLLAIDTFRDQAPGLSGAILFCVSG